MLYKYCANTIIYDLYFAQLMFNYKPKKYKNHANIAQILYKYCSIIVKTHYKYYPNIVQMLCKYCTNIVKILWKSFVYILQIA